MTHARVVAVVHICHSSPLRARAVLGPPFVLRGNLERSGVAGEEQASSSQARERGWDLSARRTRWKRRGPRTLRRRGSNGQLHESLSLLVLQHYSRKKASNLEPCTYRNAETATSMCWRQHASYASTDARGVQLCSGRCASSLPQRDASLSMSSLCAVAYV